MLWRTVEDRKLLGVKSLYVRSDEFPVKRDTWVEMGIGTFLCHTIPVTLPSKYILDRIIPRSRESNTCKLTRVDMIANWGTWTCHLHQLNHHLSSRLIRWNRYGYRLDMVEDHAQSYSRDLPRQNKAKSDVSPALSNPGTHSRSSTRETLQA